MTYQFCSWLSVNHFSSMPRILVCYICISRRLANYQCVLCLSVNPYSRTTSITVSYITEASRISVNHLQNGDLWRQIFCSVLCLSDNQNSCDYNEYNGQLCGLWPSVNHNSSMTRLLISYITTASWYTHVCYRVLSTAIWLWVVGSIFGHTKDFKNISISCGPWR